MNEEKSMVLSIYYNQSFAFQILSEWVTERLSNEDIRLDDFLEKDIKILEQHLRPFDRWRMLAEELGKNKTYFQP